MRKDGWGERKRNERGEPIAEIIRCDRCKKPVSEFRTLPWLGIGENVCFSCISELEKTIKEG